MRVAFDYQIFAAQQHGGISRYYAALAAALPSVADVTPQVIAPLHVNSHLRDTPSPLRTGRWLPQLRNTERLIRAVNGLLFPMLARAFRPDIVHETYFAPRATFPGRMPRVVTVLDMIHERFPAQFRAGDRTAADKARAVRRADHVICISAQTRRDLLALHPIDASRTTVVHLGFDRLSSAGLVAADLVGPLPYLLYVGARNGYKNFAAFAAVFATADLPPTLRIVCVGGGVMSPAERAALAASGLDETRVLHLRADDRELAALYEGALAFVYPSLYEGFGIPPLEAMAAGCPVVCSAASAMPEVGGDAVEYFDPEDGRSLCAALERVVNSPDRRAELIARGHARARQFSWERCARETVAVYTRVLSTSARREPATT